MARAHAAAALRHTRKPHMPKNYFDLTGKQGVCFRNMCRLMLALPRPATILDLMNITEERMPADYQSLNAAFSFAYYPVRWQVKFDTISWIGREPTLDVTRIAGSFGHASQVHARKVPEATNSKSRAGE